MEPSTVLSPRDPSASVKSLSIQTFAKAFVASLVDSGLDAVYPHNARDMAGFKAVVETLAAQIQDALKSGKSKEELLPLLRIVNELRPSNTGSYDGFEAALRSLQLTFTASPNPFYTAIQFPVSRNQARSYFDMLPPEYVTLARQAAAVFLKARNQARA